MPQVTESRSTNERPLMDTTSFNLDDSNVALHGYSPVSYIDEGQARQGSPDHRVEHNGVAYYLTSESEVERFQRDPDRYQPAFGGWCAFGMSVDKRFRIDPEKFKVVDGRLLVFLNDLETDALGLWEQGDDAELLKRAEEAWQTFTGSKAA